MMKLEKGHLYYVFWSHDNLIGNVILPLHKMELHGVQVTAVLNQKDETEQASSTPLLLPIINH